MEVFVIVPPEMVTGAPEIKIVPEEELVFAEVTSVWVAVSCDTVIRPVEALYTATLVDPVAETSPPEMATAPVELLKIVLLSVPVAETSPPEMVTA